MSTAPLPNTEAIVHHIPLKEPNDVLAVATPTGMNLLQLAVAQGAGIEVLERLQAIHEREEQRAAKRAFTAAMAAFKAEAPRILKNKHVHFDTKQGSMDYRHATLDHVCDVIISALSKHGLSHRWKFEQEKGLVRVTCILTHDLGHSEETTLVGQSDNSGLKNSIQADCSTVTYLERYTLLGATGLAAADSDDDGRGAPVSQLQANRVQANRVQQHCSAIAKAPDLDTLRNLYSDAYREAKAAKDFAAMDAYMSAKDARKRELE